MMFEVKIKELKKKKPFHISCMECHAHHSTCMSIPNPQHIVLLLKFLVYNKCQHELLHCCVQSDVRLIKKHFTITD